MEFIQFLQACITPVALISGVGLLLLSITNRLGRTIDRTRQLVAELNNGKVKKPREKETEIRILYKRSRYLRNSIASMVISVISSSLIIPNLFNSSAVFTICVVSPPFTEKREDRDISATFMSFRF